VHLNGYVHAAMPWSAPTLVVGHSCVYSWWHAVKGGSPPREWLKYKAAVERGLKAASVVVAPTASMLGYLRHFFEFPQLGRVIPNARSAGPFSPAMKLPYILASGRLWDEAKNIQAVAAVAPYLDWPVYAAGYTQCIGGSIGELQGLHLLGRLGSRDLRCWLEQASIFVAPARYEPFGLAILEAALAGCCLVLGDIPSLRENWDGVALFVPPDDRAALAETIETLIHDPTCRRALSKLTRAHALQFSPERMARDYLDVYQQAMLESQEVKLSGDMNQSYAFRPILPLAPVRLESRQRALPARNHRRTAFTRP
jgi:glycosyltransferase involved in cell wall biosynthesis